MKTQEILQSLQTKEISVKDAISLLDPGRETGLPAPPAHHRTAGINNKKRFLARSSSPRPGARKDTPLEIPGENIHPPVTELKEVGPGILQLTMQDREHKNTFSPALIDGLEKAFTAIRTDSSGKVVILTGYDNYFACGGTRDALLAIQEGRIKFTDRKVFALPLECNIPVIAAMQGHGIGAGWAMGMFCDFIVMSRESVYASNYMQYGFTPGAGATLIFPEKLGPGLAQEILFTGKKYRGKEFLSKGVPYPILPRDEVLSYALHLARTLSAAPRESLVQLKNHLADSIRKRLAAALAKELEMHEKTFVNQPGVKERIKTLFHGFSTKEAPAREIENRGRITPQPTPSISRQTRDRITPASPRPVANNETAPPAAAAVTRDSSSPGKQAIAIIGMSGQFPASKNLDAFWDNLANGRDCISEIPAGRWSIDRYYDPNPNTPGKTYSKWMGAVEDVETFDPLFFNISPVEAELMDPQQRLFLEHCWNCIEDSGLEYSSLSGSCCGVFAGCGTGDYAQLTGDRGLNAQGFMGESISILSARISYLLNLKGPCLAIDTACSSSLAAMVEACNSLILQTSDLALAGGVCVMSGPGIHIKTSKAGMLSKDGRCFTFDKRANGFVPGEGVGVILLKRLGDAIRDRDHIYGVIRGWGINQDGKTNGITAPSVNSQILLEKDIYQRFKINPETISLVEAHGTGTKLGDPIEVEALIESFRSFTQKKNYCALGSVKSNIGHLMTAAGAAGVIKVLLALQHRMLPPTIHFEQLNEHISLDNSPFYINTQLRPWGPALGTPRRAAVSSFGFSGTNAHIIVEEYLPGSGAPRTPITINAANPILLVLSAKSEEQLKDRARDIKDYIETHPDINLADMAYTLQVGREAMEYRLALEVDSREALTKILGEFLGHDSPAALLTGRAKKNPGEVKVFGMPEQASALLQNRMQKRELKKLAELWVKGLDIDWNRLYSQQKPRRISLPTYPFARERCWAWDPGIQDDPVVNRGGNASVEKLHPLIHKNISNLEEMKFTSTFTGREFFLKDHQVENQKVLPGAAYLEMARAAGQMAGTQDILQLKNIVWTRPIQVNEKEQKVEIRLYPGSNHIVYEVATPGENTGDPVIHSQGRLMAGSNHVQQPQQLDLDEIRRRCSSRLDAPACYEMFEKVGLKYGETFQGIKTLHYNGREALARLRLPAAADRQDSFVLHPSLVDAALQTIIGLTLSNQDQEQYVTYLPYALGDLYIYRPPIDTMYAYTRKSESMKPDAKMDKFDIDLTDEQGNLYVTMKGFSGRPLTHKARNLSVQTGENSETGMLYAVSQWKIKAIEPGGTDGAPQHASLFLGGYDKEIMDHLQNQFKDIPLHRLPDPIPDQTAVINSTFQKVFHHIKKILDQKPEDNHYVVIIVPDNPQKFLYTHLRGLLKTAALENPKIKGKIIQVRSKDVKILTEITRRELNPAEYTDMEVRYRDDAVREVRQLTETGIEPVIKGAPIKEGGVYWIIGGMGGLGRIFTRHIGRGKGVKIILSGRSTLDETKDALLEQLQTTGINVHYIPCDVSRSDDVKKVYEQVKTGYGKPDGIIHAAGVIEDCFILKKTHEEINRVMEPKVAGLINIDAVTKDETLDFMMLFSSIAGVTGNTGQCDYSSANAFLDDYAAYRQELVQEGKRSGKTVSINWPLWKDGGMRVDEQVETLIVKNMGLTALETASGREAFDAILNGGQCQVLVLAGQLSRLREKWLSGKEPAGKTPTLNRTGIPKKQTGLPEENNLKDIMINYLKQVIGDTLKVKQEKIDIDKSLDKYGLDSIMVLDINNKLERHFPGLSKTLFFEYGSVNDLAGYFIEFHKETVIKIAGVEELEISLPHDMEQQNQEIHPDNSRHNRAEYLVKKWEKDKNREQVPDRNLYKDIGLFDANVEPEEFISRQIEGGQLLFDEVITKLRLEIHHPDQYEKKERELAGISPGESPGEDIGEGPVLPTPFQSFAPFEEPLESFSFSRFLINPHENPEDIKYVIEKQIELRKVLFYKEDFHEVKKVLDIGCGTAADLVEIARLNPAITAHGLTISAEEKEYAENLVREKELEKQVKIFCRDNTRHEYEDNYDIIFAIQVMHFINEISQKNLLFKKMSAAIRPRGKILLAEFICHLNNPLHDSFLNVTVPTVNQWVELLSNHGLLIEDIIDVSKEIENSLHDPGIDRHIKHSDEKTRIKLKKYNKQVDSLRNGWVSYCLLKIVKDNRCETVQERMRVNLEKIENKRPYKEAKKEMTAVQDSMTYNPPLDRLPGSFNLTSVDLSVSQQENHKKTEPLIIHEKELENNPQMAGLIADIDNKYPPLGYERLLYPYFFISSDKSKYIRVIIDEPNHLIIPFMLITEPLYRELAGYGAGNNHQILVVDGYHGWLDNDQTRLIPIGVIQDLEIDGFTLKGNRMRKLRYLTEKFKKSGQVKIEEYRAGSSLPLKEMRELMIKWGESKNNIIHHSVVCMEELLRQTLPRGHRAFLTYHNGSLCSIIVIEKGENGYIMDQEFYDPAAAPLGHMEYSIVEIIMRLKEEGAGIFSLGVTWHPFIFEDDPRKDPGGWAWLKQQNEKQTLLSRIFQQAEPNYRFKKKFGEVGEPVFAYIPAGSPDTLLLKYWPVFYQNSLTAVQLAQQLNREFPEPVRTPKKSNKSFSGGSRGAVFSKRAPLAAGGKSNSTLNREKRQEILEKAGKLEKVVYHENPLDLMTDTWYHVRSEAVKERAAYLEARSSGKSPDVVRRIFPFKHILLTRQGRTAEMLFYRAYPKTKKKIVTTIPWTTTLMHQLKNGFDVVEIPHAAVYEPRSPHLFRGEIHLEALEKHLEKEGNKIAMVGLEVLSNAAGGHPVRWAHMGQLKAILEPGRIPLVLDASRIVRNACLIAQYETPHREKTVWEIVRETAARADHIVTSLTKDFALHVGGLIATNDDALAAEIKEIRARQGEEPDQTIENMIKQALSEQDTILELVTRQMSFTKRLGDMLLEERIPLLHPACGHAVVIEVTQYTDGETGTPGKERFLRDLFIETGIRGGIHQVGKQKNTILDRCIRLAIPLGLTREDENLIYERLQQYFKKKQS